MNEKQLSFLKVMPIGYMTAFVGDTIPTGFIEVDGQKLIKSDNMKLFNILRGVVLDQGDYFVLPDKRKIFEISKSNFGGVDVQKSKIIMKVA